MEHIANQDSRGLARLLDIDLADARRLLGAAVARGKTIRDARNVRRAILDRATATLSEERLHVAHREDAADGFRRYLFELRDGARVESVRIPLFDTHHTLCLSSQVGCALACTFCATGRLGLTRNLEPWEMVAQWMEVRRDSRLPHHRRGLHGAGGTLPQLRGRAPGRLRALRPGRRARRRAPHLHLHRRRHPHDPALHRRGAQVPALRVAQRGHPGEASRAHAGGAGAAARRAHGRGARARRQAGAGHPRVRDDGRA